MNDTLYIECIKEIVRSQMAIIGPMAVEQANKSGVIQIDSSLDKVSVTQDGKAAVKKLIDTYAELFGKISIEVSHEAIDKALKKNNAQAEKANIIE